ncbi:hypothetical protein [Ancrocorticia populi]|uniref:Uncharacterized protein n=1 Tax=Ancrocorticia populi TaxID=2175228 RepID=A0A2V1JZI8_9ACTO|nr:hypothetical protein [Ancrocorticia populi]PWF24434.1 hypothetical protein DD236_11505 [Ancrocorticia populi]
MPIFDTALDEDTLRREVERFDVDSVYAENPPDELVEFLRKHSCEWNGRAELGPFGDERGLLGANALLASARIEQDAWHGPTAPAIAVAAYLGKEITSDKQVSGRPINDTTSLLKLATSFVRPTPPGFVILRDQNGQDVIQFWNCRSLSNNTYPLTQDSAEFNNAVLADVPDVTGFLQSSPTGAQREVPVEIPVWGYDDLDIAEQERLDEWAKKQHSELIPLPRKEALKGSRFPGFERILSNSFRINVGATTRLIPLDIPELPLRDNLGFFPGIVAAEVGFREASGVDPRLTLSIPPYRRHAKLIDRPGYGADQTRISSVGPVLGIQANLDEISVLNAYQMDVMRLLFDDDLVVVGQSDEGKFQTRAAELFGGPLTAHLNQPGVRAAIQEAGTRMNGLTQQHLENTVSSHRGEWPDAWRAYNETPLDYSQRQVRLLLNSGMFVPFLSIVCPECRTALRLAPEQLGTAVRCEFCGTDVRLALALALTKPQWSFRLAGHLPSSRVQAFLPAMAASGVLASLNNHVEGPRPNHMFGLEVQLPGQRKVEVDIAMIMNESGWLVVLGEVKNHNPIDSNDVRNLFSLCSALLAQGVLAIPLFATFKEDFSTEEQSAIRAMMDMVPRRVFVRGKRLPLTPLTLTRRDMSLPFLHDDHPWRWVKPGVGTGLVGTALESCKKNLGLEDVIWQGTDEQSPRFRWAPLPEDRA